MYVQPYYVLCIDIILYACSSYVANIVLVILYVINDLYYITLCVLNICVL